MGVIGGRGNWACHMRGEIGQLIGRGRRIRNGEGPSVRWEKLGIREEKGNGIHREQGTVHLEETLGGSSLEGEVHWVSLPHKEDCYIKATPFQMA